MGFGQDDQLVLIPDAGDPVKLVAYWRNAIPDEAKQTTPEDLARLSDLLWREPMNDYELPKVSGP